MVYNTWYTRRMWWSTFLPISESVSTYIRVQKSDFLTWVALNSNTQQRSPAAWREHARRVRYLLTLLLCSYRVMDGARKV